MIPLTIRVGCSFSAYSPMMTASVGLPATDHAGIPFITTLFARSGSKIEIDLPTALCWVAGATTVTSAIGAIASYAAQRPIGGYAVIIGQQDRGSHVHSLLPAPQKNPSLKG